MAVSGAEVLGPHGVEEFAELPDKSVGIRVLGVFVFVVTRQENTFCIHQFVRDE
jgi:hypothetical protein